MQYNDINKLLNVAFNEELNIELDLKKNLDDKLKEYDLSKTKVINILNIDKDVFDDIINGNAKQPSLINIIKIATFLEIDLDIAISAILKNQSVENINSLQKAEKASFILKNFDVKKLTKIGFLKESDDVEYFITRILSFFGYKSIYDYENNLAAPLYSKSKRNFSDKMKDFWVKSAYKCFKEINNTNEYDRDLLKDLIVKIKPYSQDITDGLFTVCKALYSIGVTVIFQNQLPTTQIRGATFIINNKPCIVLTDLFKKYSTIWFVLIHELYHVLYDLETINKTSFHLTGDPDLFLIEEKADEFSREYFVGIEQYRFIRSHINNEYIVSKYAKEWEVHPSLIYSNFQYFEQSLNNKNYYNLFHDSQPEFNMTVRHLHPITWKEESIATIAKNLKSIFELNIT